jgi:hypothetical protein
MSRPHLPGSAREALDQYWIPQGDIDAILIGHTLELADKQRSHLVAAGYNLNCTCHAHDCPACLGQTLIRLIEPEAVQ